MVSVQVSGTNDVLITGIIKGQEDYTEIKNRVQDIVDRGTKRINIKISDSNSISSSVIGYFMKVVNKDEVNLNITVNDNRLYKIFSDLNLVTVFNVTKE